MYILIDEIIVPSRFQSKFEEKLPYFKDLYLSIKGVKSVAYARTALKCIGKTTIKYPNNSFLLIITFDNEASFLAYHDNSTSAREIHVKIAKEFEGKQLSIAVSLHGDLL